VANASSERPPATADLPSEARIGPGTVVLIVGPSGAGKDALIQGAEDQLGPDPAFHFPRRLINRAAHTAEAHDVLSDGHADAPDLSQTFPLSWQAHGLTYALPAEIDNAVRAGRCVVFNASRTIVGAARDRYRTARVIYIDAPLDVRARRLGERGRETSVEIRDRLAREVASFSPADADIVIENTATLDAGIAALSAALRHLAGPP
jgi:ribose 1,5-bisphosphokinase